MSKHIALLGTALVLAAGCGGGAQTDKPVATSTSRGTTTSPSGDATDNRGTSQVRLVSVLPAAQRLDLVADDSVVFAAVPYKTVTPYKELKDNAAKFAISKPGVHDNPLASNNEAMADGHRYTLVALPEEKGSGAQLKAFRDEVVPDAGKAKVRVINAVPNAGELDVVLSGHKDALFEDIDYGHEAGFKEIDPQSGTLQIRRDGGDLAKAPKTIDAGRVQFEAGRAYTLVVAGNAAKPEVVRFVDEQVGGATKGGEMKSVDRTHDSAVSGTRETSVNDRGTGATSGSTAGGATGSTRGGMTSEPDRRSGATAPSRNDRTQPPANVPAEKQPS